MLVLGLVAYQFSTSGSLTASSTGWTTITNTKSEITKTYSASSNGTYYFYVKDDAGNINKKSVVISNIDKTLPEEFNFYPSEVGGTNFRDIIGSTTDLESGIAYYQYSKDGGITWQDANSFEGLKASTAYNLQMRAIDNAGNIRYSPKRETSTASANIMVHNINSSGFELIVWGRGYSSVSIAVWSDEKNGQDDIIWYPATVINSNGECSVKVKLDMTFEGHHHGDTGGWYIAHAYAQNATVFLDSIRFWVPREKIYRWF